MKQLQNRFIGRGEVKGFVFSKIHDTNKGFIYEVDTGNGKHYEVFKRVKNTQYNCISYPTSKAFGKWAWSVGKLEKAYKILTNL